MNTFTPNSLKKTEKLYADGNFDTKKKLNRSQKTVSITDIEKINEGVTSEFLDTMDLPIFKYGGQITIHGLFPEIDSVYVGGYKHIIQNKNKSIGVKYNAIDYAKKLRIYKALGEANGFKIQKNSNEFYSYKTTKFSTNKSEVIEAYNKELKPIADRINKGLFYGSVNGTIGFIPFYGFVGLLDIRINAIYEKNVTDLIENITDKSVNEIERIIAKKEAERKAKIDANNKEWEQRKAEKESIFNEFKTQANTLLSDNNFIQTNEVPKLGKYIQLTQNYNNECYYNVLIAKKSIKYYKVDSNKFETFADALNFYNSIDVNNYQFSYRASKTVRLRDIYSLADTCENKPTESTKKVSDSNRPQTNNTDVILIDYSTKAIALIGNTKPIKEKIKSLGGRFNKYLTVDNKKVPGWIFPKAKQSEIINRLNL